ncbi:MAG: sulfatase-like hydrolase/transferase [Prevotella sp.]|nr:sulfatase-like hydrolase/transferase [Prevotella sp.]
MKSLKLSISTFLKISGLIVVLGFILRVVLLFNPSTVVNYSFLEWIQIFLLGTFNDIFFAVISFSFFCLFLLFFSEVKYKKPWSYIIYALLAITYIVLQFINTPLREFNAPLTRIICYLLLYRIASYTLRLFFPVIREYWRQYTYYIVFFVYVLFIVFNAIAEYFFWSEFGLRYNFIAVDYLVYTNEVIGNFFESYPMVPLISLVVLLSGGISYGLLRNIRKNNFNIIPSLRDKLISTAAYIVLSSASFGLLFVNFSFQHGNNSYVNELQANGCVKFCQAFFSNKLCYKDFYNKISDAEAVGIINSQYGRSIDNIQHIHSDKPEIHKNIVLITIESMSGEFLKRFGNTQNITPNLDNLMQQGLCFDNLYAVGNRTVRGLEAVTLCIPPSSGESIIKQENNSGLFSTAKVLHSKGYNVNFIYGGDSYFDNMKSFFSGNGFKVIDKSDFKGKELTFSTVWGACDEDMFNKAIKVFNGNAKVKKPFFANIMTVSNHRPYTYPDGRIDIPSSNKCREGGVKYTDYAIGKFFEMAKKQPWFNNTIFIITADHCASSAGSTDIPLDQYHIPALIYAPGFVKPSVNKTLLSQIDLMPTVFGLLHFSYESRFFGQNVLSKSYHPRAFAATYQNLGYIENNKMIVLSAGHRQQQFRLLSGKYSLTTGAEQHNIDKSILHHAIANYQCAGDIQKKK